MKTILTLMTACAMTCMIQAGAWAQESNRTAVRANVYRGGWYPAWGVTINEAEYTKFTAAVAAAVVSGNAGPVLTYFDALLERTIVKLQKQIPGLTRQAVYDLIVNAWKTQGRSVKRLNLEVQAGVATYRRWKRIVVDVPDGTERYKIYGPRDLFTGKRTWTYGYRPKLKRVV